VDIGEDYFVIMPHGKRIVNNYGTIMSVEELPKEKG